MVGLRSVRLYERSPGTDLLAVISTHTCRHVWMVYLFWRSEWPWWVGGESSRWLLIPL